MPPHFWEFPARDYIDKYNHTAHRFHKQLSESLWSPTPVNITTLLPFSQHGYVSNPAPKSKPQPRSQLHRYLYRADATHHVTWNLTTKKTTSCRASKFTSYDPPCDPVSTQSRNQQSPPPTRHSTPVLLNHNNNCIATIILDDHIEPLMSIPTFCFNTLNHTAEPGDTATNPRSLRAARQAPESHLWEQSWNAELTSLEKHGTLSYIPKSSLPPYATLLPLKFTLRLKRDEASNVISRNPRCTARGDKQIPHVHYDPDNISSPVPDRDAVLCSLALTAGTPPIAEYWDLESAFLHEMLGPEETI